MRVLELLAWQADYGSQPSELIWRVDLKWKLGGASWQDDLSRPLGEANSRSYHALYEIHICIVTNVLTTRDSRLDHLCTFDYFN